MTKKLMVDDLAKSGLTENDIRKLKIKYCIGTQTEKLTDKKFKCESFKIPYLDIDGKDTGFYRIRLLNPVRGFTKPRRYTQPAETMPHAYFPAVIDWKK